MIAPTQTRHRFRAMGVSVEVLAAAAPADLGDAVRKIECEFERLERIFSRFDPASELSRLNAAGTAPASEELLALSVFALAAREASGGLVDVTVHDAVVAWGYDRTYAELEGRDPPAPSRVPTCAGVFAVNLVDGTVRLDGDTHLDFGGLAKGFAVDRSLALLGDLGPAVVNAGGDLAVVADTAPWPVGVTTPEGGLTLELARGALATSGRDARRWQVGGREAHHLIDPRTGRPSTSDLIRATAWAPSATEAEVLAKQLYLLGAADARAHADDAGIPAVLVPAHGPTILAGGLA